MLPFVYEPSASGSSQISAQPDPTAYVKARKRELLASLHKHGAILLRNFAVEGTQHFQEIFKCFVPGLRNYLGGDSPRTAVTDKVYTSTNYPPSLPIPLHNEMSYTRDYPSYIGFYCETPPDVDGETPLADCREVLKLLPSDTLERIKSRHIRYLQNLSDGPGIGKSWRETFETDHREDVEAILKMRGAAFQWKDDGSLYISEVVDPIVTHPHTGDTALFSQAHMWHVSSLDAKTRKALLRMFAEDDLYHNCTFGDGSRLTDEDLHTMRCAYDEAAVTFPWQKNDILLVDNVLVAHGRRPFQGQRRILVAMG